jgi:hypothetical protein
MTEDRRAGPATAEAVGRRRPARPAVAAVLLLVALLVAAGLVAAVGDDDPSGPGGTSAAGSAAPPETKVPSGPLVEMATGPLSPRDAPATAWTGEELVVVGGTVEGTPARDGAAYDPATDTWRPIADAPAPVDARQVAVWTGEEMVVTATTGAFAYDPAADAWRTLDQRRVPESVESNLVLPVVTPDGIVYPASHQPDSPDSPDLLLDADDTFVPLPRDPFGESWDRSMAWDGERLWLLSTAAEDDAQRGNDDDRAPSRLAVLEGGVTDGTWRVVDDETPGLAPEALLWWCGGELVVDRSAYREAQTFDRGSGTWSDSGAADADTCALASTERDGLAGGSLPSSALGERFAWDSTVPGCPFVRRPDTYLWAGDDLVVWDAATTLGCRTTGSPGAVRVPDPCPDRLLGDGRERFGFGPVAPAAGAPALGEPEAAYVCRYLPEGPPPSEDGPYMWESDLCCEAVRLTDAERERLVAYLADLAPPRAGRCPADRLALNRQRRLAGPRYLVTLRTGDDLTGVVLDDFGCGHVRLTDDPFELEPGTHRGSGGVVPGVLRAPDDLVARLFDAVRLRYGQVERFPPPR